MGVSSYTLDGGELVERHIEKILNNVTKDIVSALRPMAVVLSGSLGRGEGTAYLNDGSVVMVSDFEIGCISRNWFKRARLKRLAGELADRYGIDITLNFFLPRRFTRGAPANWAPAGNLLNIEQYELMEFSRNLYGVDLSLQTPKVDSRDIPLWEGIRLLYNRMAEFIDALYLDSSFREVLLLKACNKLLIASGDTLLLSARRYHGKYLERMERVVDLANSDGTIKDLFDDKEREALRRGYELKLYPQNENAPKIDEWVALSLSISEKVFRYIIGKDMGLDFSTYDKFALAYSIHPRLKIYCRTSSRLQNLISLVKTGAKVGSIGLMDFLGPVSAQHKVYVELPEFLYGRLLPKWSDTGSKALKDSAMRADAKELVESWRRLCE